jgi:hypothetical protein
MRWPKRLEQAQSHTPRGISTVATWTVEASTAVVNRMEAMIADRLPRRKGHVREWFDLSADEAISHVARMLQREPDFRSSNVELRYYDDWRSKGINDWRSRLWLFEEYSSERRFKLIYSCLNDTIYRYAFTYNPFPVFLVAGWELPDNLPERFGRGLKAFRLHNQVVEARWRDMVKRFNDNVPSASIGWLNRGVDRKELEMAVERAGFRRFPLSRAKPADAAPRDPSLNPPTEIGQVPPMTRVRESETPTSSG